MRMRALITGALTATVAVVAVAAPAGAVGKADIQYVGSDGTWSASGTGFSVATEEFTGYFQPDSGELPPWPGCAPGTGTVEIPSESTPITLSLDGDVCVAIAAPGYVIFKGFLEIVPFPKKPGGRAELTGLGNFDLRLLTDGTLTYYVEGWFTKARH